MLEISLLRTAVSKLFWGKTLPLKSCIHLSQVPPQLSSFCNQDLGTSRGLAGSGQTCSKLSRTKCWKQERNWSWLQNIYSILTLGISLPFPVIKIPFSQYKNRTYPFTTLSQVVKPRPNVKLIKCDELQ